MSKQQLDPEEKERKRKKQFRKMGRILGKIWDLDPAFQTNTESDDNDNDVVTCLSQLGERIDQHVYHLGRHGWAHFARDLAGVYLQHIHG